MSLAMFDRNRANQICRDIVAVAKSVGRLLGAVAIATVGGAIVTYAAIDILKPDSELLEHALKIASYMTDPPAPSALAERDTALGQLAIGAFILLAGVNSLRTWWKSLPFRKAVSSK